MYDSQHYHNTSSSVHDIQCVIVTSRLKQTHAYIIQESGLLVWSGAGISITTFLEMQNVTGSFYLTLSDKVKEEP